LEGRITKLSLTFLLLSRVIAATQQRYGELSRDRVSIAIPRIA